MITAGLASIMENETPANVLKYPLPAKELPGCYNCVYLLACLYFITLDLRDAIKRRQNFGNSYQQMLCLGRSSFCILMQIVYACLSLPVYGILSKPSPVEEAEKTIRTWIVLYLKLEALSFQAPQACVASSVLGRVRNKSVGQSPLPQSFCFFWFLSSFFLGHCGHPTAYHHL